MQKESGGFSEFKLAISEKYIQDFKDLSKKIQIAH
jgi:hypothetical protein